MKNRGNAVCLLRILAEYSDEFHILQMQDIISKFKLLYDVDIDRRTVYGLIDVFAELGYDVSDYNDNGVGYFLRERYFEPSEIHLLMDAIYSHQAIPEKQTEELIAKLQRLLSVHNRKKYKSLSVIKSNKKTKNKQVFFNVEKLDEAIQSGKKVSFVYLIYGLDKQLHPRKHDRYVVSPYQLICANEHYYLLCKDSKHNTPSLYRIDLMKDIEITNEMVDADITERELEDVKERTTYAWNGKVETIKLKCKNYVIGDLLDKFGHDIVIQKMDDDHFSATIKTVPEGMCFWSLQYLPHVEVLSPQWVRDEIVKVIQNNMYTQGGNKE